MSSHLKFLSRCSLHASFAVSFVLGPSACSFHASTADQIVGQSTEMIRPSWKYRVEKVFSKGGSWVIPRDYRGCVQVGQVQYGATGAKDGGAVVESETGGSAPEGYSAFLEVYIEVSEGKTISFSGTGLTMTLRSKYLHEYANDDFSVFIYDVNNNLLQQYELGAPSGDSFTFPSLYQNGFIVNPPHFTGGNFFVLAYADTRLRVLTPRPPECGV